MKINSVVKIFHKSYSQMTEKQKSMEKSQSSSQVVSQKTDTLDISKEAYKTPVSDETMCATQGVSWSDFEWKSYETQMSVTIDGTPSITGIEKGEVNQPV